MKVTIESAALRRAAVRAARIADPRANIPILRNVRLTAGKDALTIEANNLEISLAADVPAQVDKPGKCSISAADFRAFCEVIGDGAQIVMEMRDGSLHASAGSRRARFSTLPPEDFPEPRKAIKPWKTEAADIARAISFAAPAASNETLRYYLCAVAFDDAAAVATDGHALHAMPIAGASSCILPDAHIPAILDAMGIDGAEFGATVTGWSVGAPGFLLAGQCIDGSFPDWRRIIPEFTAAATMHRDEFMEALDAATLKGQAAVVLAAAKDGDDAISLSSARDIGDASAECPAADVSAFRIVLDSKLLRAALAGMPIGEVLMEVSGTVSSRISPAGEDGRFAVIMQMRG